jgi:hypothetical protein
MAKQQTLSKPQPMPEALDLESLTPLTPSVRVSEASAVVARLHEQREKVSAERAAAENRMGEHSYAAHAKGDEKALAALDEIATTIARLDARIREVDLAIAEASKHLDDARRDEAQAADRERAMDIRCAIERLKAAGQTLDGALAVLAYRGHCTCLRDGDVQVEPRRSNLSALARS